MINCLFASDLHGSEHRYNKLFKAIYQKQPQFVFLGGDLLPGGSLAGGSLNFSHYDFVNRYLANQLSDLKEKLGHQYPKILVIMGNDDARRYEATFLELATQGLWHYMHNRRASWLGYDFYGYSYVPPSPFILKDWERYDVSRFTDPGCSAPMEGHLSVPVSQQELTWSTIKEDLETLTSQHDLQNSVFLFHAPPYDTCLDRAALDDQYVDSAPLDVHVGSIAIKRFIEDRQPLLTMHGHIHESSRITGCWQQQIGTTYTLGAAWDDPELALVEFDLTDLSSARRLLL